MPGETVVWAVVSGGGSLSGAGSVTDSDGVARAEWTLGTGAGPQAAEARQSGNRRAGFDARGRAREAATIILDPASLELEAGAGARLSAAGFDKFGNPVEGDFAPAWSTTDPGVATVSAAGEVMAIGPGSTMVTASSADASASATVTVAAPPADAGSLLGMSGDGQGGAAGGSLPGLLEVRLLDTDGAPMAGRAVDWEIVAGGGSLSEARTSTDADGRAAVAWTLGGTVGVQIARASSGGLTPVSFSASVTAGPLTSLSLTPTTASLEAGDTVRLEAAGADAFGNPVDPTPTWVSGDGSVASVSQSGLVTAVAEGIAEIGASVGDVSASAEVAVSASVPPRPGPGSLVRVDGDAQSAGPGTVLPVDLQVRLLDTAGDPMAGEAVSWSVTSGGGAISASSVTTDLDGRASVTWTLGTSAGNNAARASFEALGPVDFSAVTEPGPLTHLELMPSGSTDLEVGGQVALEATGTDAWGNDVTPLSLDWSSSDAGVATVGSGGRVTAVAAGSAIIEAEMGGVTAHIEVTVTAAPPPPPPSGRTVYFEEAFENTDFASRGWYDNTGMAVTADEAHAGSSSLRIRFDAGARTPTWGNAARMEVPETESLYVRYWVKYSDNWVGSERAYHPHEFYLLTNKDGRWTGPSTTYLTTYIETTAQGGAIRPKLGLGDRRNIDTSNIGNDLSGITENRAVAGCNGETDGHRTGCWNAGGGEWGNEKLFVAGSADITEGSWHLVEVYFEMNTISAGIGQTDGTVRYWLDGALVIDHTDVLFRTGANADMKFNQFMIAPYIGDGSPVTQTMWVDDLQVADRR
jgi:uncharacterized protein YjdB